MTRAAADVLEVSGVRDINGKTVTIIEGATAVQIQSVGDRCFDAAQCRRFARQLYRCARRLEVRMEREPA